LRSHSPNGIRIKLGVYDYDLYEYQAKEYDVSLIINHPGTSFLFFALVLMQYSGPMYESSLPLYR